MKRVVKFISVVLVMCLLSACTGEKAQPVAMLSNTMMDVQMGTKGTVSVLNYEGEVKWTSSDTSFAVVSDKGEISPISVGSVVVTATLENGETMSCVVEVLPGESSVEKIVVTSYYSSVSDITVNYNDSDTVRLKAECSPLDPVEKLTWSSSDESLAKVTGDGVVVVYGNGIVDIMATALNGVSGSCKLRIKNVPENVASAHTEEAPVIGVSSGQGALVTSVPVRSATAESNIIISQQRVYLDVAEYEKIEFTVRNASASDVRWVSTDKSIAVVKDGFIVGVGEGIATISAVTNDGAVASCRVAVGKEAKNELKKEIPAY